MNDNLSDWIRRMFEKKELSVYDEMTLTRHHVFAAYNLAVRNGCDGKEAAERVLVEAYKYGRVDSNAALGVGVEILFFDRFRDEFCLAPALDCGDHADFIGLVDNCIIRFDVTTQLAAKNSLNYCGRDQEVVVYDCESKKETWRFYSAWENKSFEIKSTREF